MDLYKKIWLGMGSTNAWTYIQGAWLRRLGLYIRLCLLGPLAPGEIYYGYSYYGPYSINIVNVKVNIPKVVYKNINVPNGYVVIHKNNFLTAKQIYEKTYENPFISRKVMYGRPEFYKEGIKKVIIGRKFVVHEKNIPKMLFIRKI